MHEKEFEWVIGRWGNDSTPGKYALDLADAGVGYHKIGSDRKKGDDIILAFRRPIDGSKPFPAHLAKASAVQAERLDKLDRKRSGAQR